MHCILKAVIMESFQTKEWFSYCLEQSRNWRVIRWFVWVLPGRGVVRRTKRSILRCLFRIPLLHSKESLFSCSVWCYMKGECFYWIKNKPGGKKNQNGSKLLQRNWNGVFELNYNNPAVKLCIFSGCFMRYVFWPGFSWLNGGSFWHFAVFSNWGRPVFSRFSFNEFLSGFLFGLFLYRKPISLPRVFFARLSVVVLINLILTPLWLSILYKNAFIVLLATRIVKNLIMLPIETAILYVVCKKAASLRPYRAI